MESQAHVTDADAAPAGAVAAAITDSPQAHSPRQATEQADAGLSGEASQPPAGEEYLLFWMGETPYLVRLAELREALPGVPKHVALPFSPQWLWGIFPLRTDLVALVDPLPTLMHGPDAARSMHVTGTIPAARANDFGPTETPRALVVGEGDHLLALLTDHIGDICLVQAEDQRAPIGQAERGSGPLPQYVAGVYSVAGLEREAVALHVSALADDIFAALEERPAHE